LKDPELWKAEGGWEEDKGRVDAINHEHHLFKSLSNDVENASESIITMIAVR
jgi:hypothetical protein